MADSYDYFFGVRAGVWCIGPTLALVFAFLVMSRGFPRRIAAMALPLFDDAAMSLCYLCLKPMRSQAASVQCGLRLANWLLAVTLPLRVFIDTSCRYPLQKKTPNAGAVGPIK